MNNSSADYWNNTPLHELSHEQWEMLCDGCGKCCLHKLQDEDTNEVFYTRVACKLLDTKSGGCQDYDQRFSRVPDCMDVAKMLPSEMAWLPNSCAYRLRADNKPLPQWHPLISGKQSSVHKETKSIRGRVVSEVDVDEADLENYIIRWIDA
ncbi:YcgN family cysteine cluster protein [Luminiphilus sp.]|nr:YcgN family cysteine cluster protein [Halieaceae bacterium]MBT5555571.1 YcgN family cysteine cluster protein [Halieaceae bacterium]MBT6181502.1 YcgN family cysteine cluster protein [Halieaceae bacterium]MDC6459761.1 YcgN family cysteine cluster protein [Luminiphilus sp.]